MSRKCHTPGRNFCAPSGKIAALFVDWDGTISVCEKYFEESKQRFVFFMSMLGFDRQEADKLMRDSELAYIEKHGFERDALAKAMAGTYRRLCTKHKVRFKKHLSEICWDIGRSPFFREPELFANAAAVLGRAHHNFRIIAVTIGNREAQKYKIRQAGLATVFDDIIITHRDDKAKLVQAAIDDLNIDPKLSAFIGNSLRSDGACLKVTNFCWLPMEGGWAFDRRSALPENTGYECFEVKDWREAEEHGINRLLRRRQASMELGSESKGEGAGHPKATPRPGSKKGAKARKSGARKPAAKRCRKHS